MSARVVCLIQARMGSTRLPGKVLMKIGDRTLLERVAERVIRMQSLCDWAIATSELAKDDAIVELCRRRGWRCVRGSALDVCDRYHAAARELAAEHVVRVTADCPLLGWEEGDRVVDTHLVDGNDYTHNLTCWGSGMPIGTGLEAMSRDVLEQAWRHGRAPHHREHVTEWIYEQRERLRFALVTAPRALARPAYRLTIDHPHDLEFVRRVQLATVGPSECAPLRAVIECIDRDGGMFQEARRAA